MAKIKVNGREVEAPEGANLLFFLNDTLGLDIPHYCFHPALEKVGSCRMCQVEFVQRGKGPDGKETVRRVLGVSCRETVRDGLEVETHSPAALEARREAMEFLLLNHPLDCPICDKAGECKLQDYAYQTGQLEGRTIEPRRSREKLVDLGDVILLDRERCILCTRCVRFFKQFEGRAQLGVVERGDRSYISTFFDRPLTGYYQGNLADVCPVGALTLKKFRFKQRAWDLTPVPSICPLCSRGCNIYLDVARHGVVRRIRPRVNSRVNGWFICDQGRLEFDDLNDLEGRLRFAKVRLEGRLEERPMEEALARAAGLIREAGKGLLALASPFLTVEEGQAFLSLVEEAGFKGFWSPPPTGRGDRHLRTDDPCPNRWGLEQLGLPSVHKEDLVSAISGASLVFLAGERLLSLLPPEILSLCAVKPVVLIERVLGGLEGAIQVALPGASWAEKSGTFVNAEGKRQEIRPALSPPGDAAPDGRILEELRRLVLLQGAGKEDGQ